MHLAVNDLVMAVAIGGFCLLASFFVGLHQILLSPDAINYPKAPLLTRMLMFGWSAFLLYRATVILSGVFHGQPQHIDRSALPASAFMAAVHANLLWAVLRQRLPARTWKHFDRVFDLAMCQPWWKPFSLERVRNRVAGQQHATTKEGAVAMAELAMRGATVVRPGGSILDA